jgi:hypothetical protein
VFPHSIIAVRTNHFFLTTEPAEFFLRVLCASSASSAVVSGDGRKVVLLKMGRSEPLDFPRELGFGKGGEYIDVSCGSDG